MTRTRFDPVGDLILVNAELWGPLGSEVLTLVVDTAATETLILPEVLGRVGRSVRQAVQRTRVTSAIGDEPGFTIRVSKFSALGFEKDNFLIHAHDLGEDAGIHGLLGLSFLRTFNYEIRSIEGQIVVEPAVTHDRTAAVSMSIAETKVADFVAARLESVLRRPEAWGTNFAVEERVLQLLEVRRLLLDAASLPSSNTNAVVQRYARYLARELPEATPEPLTIQLERLGRTSELTTILSKFVDEDLAECNRVTPALTRGSTGER